MSDIISPRIKKDLPTAEYVRSVLAYDPETGLLHWLKRPPGYNKSTRIAGTTRLDGYREVCIQGRKYKIHRIAVLLMAGHWPTQQVDHIDGVRDNNRWSNLREADQAINMQNLVSAKANNRTGLLGVTKRRTGFQARITANGIKHDLGWFPTPEKAHAIYLEAKRRLHQGCVS